MKLPRHEQAVVERSKIVGYLLAHEDNSGKAGFFTRFGFTQSHWRVFAALLLRHAAQNEVERVEESAFGVKYVIEGPLITPDGRNPQIRSVWIIDRGEVRPRLVTAYPLKR